MTVGGVYTTSHEFLSSSSAPFCSLQFASLPIFRLSFCSFSLQKTSSNTQGRKTKQKKSRFLKWPTLRDASIFTGQKKKLLGVCALITWVGGASLDAQSEKGLGWSLQFTVPTLFTINILFDTKQKTYSILYTIILMPMWLSDHTFLYLYDKCFFKLTVSQFLTRAVP